MAYCQPNDVTSGNIMPPRGLTKQNYVDSAAEEMDAELGKVYKLPLTPAAAVGEDTWAGKLLKKINIFLARGRLVVDAASGGEDNSINSYGYYHLKVANDALASLVSGAIELPGVEKLDVDTTKLPPGPVIENREAGSFVDAFYRQSVGKEPVPTVYPNNGRILPW